MEDEIKVGEWIRTHDGEIDRVIDIRDTLGERKLVGFERHISLKSDIGLRNITKKHSSNIIDLIECGDYVNGEQITNIWNGNRLSSVKSNFSEEDIKSIVTHQQFKSIQYTIHEREEKENE